MKPPELKQFVTKCIESGTSFVASEFSTPDFSTLAEDNRVKLVTVFREPLARYVSNFNFDRYYGHNSAARIEDYHLGSARSICKANYYCNTLLGRHFDPPPVGESELDQALATLNLFDLVMMVEQPMSFHQLKSIGWNFTNATDKKTGSNLLGKAFLQQGSIRI